MYALLPQPRRRWLGHTGRMKDGRTPKDILYGGMATEWDGIFSVIVIYVGGT